MIKSHILDNSLRDYIEDNLQDPWKGTELEGYVYLSPKQKGEFGERLVSKILTSLNFLVEKASTSGHDRIIDGIKTEIKFSVAIRDRENGVIKDNFFLNHISIGKDWERLIFLGINSLAENDYYLVYFTKNNFIENIASPFISIQQSGSHSGNDDYFVSRVHSKDFLNLDWVKNILQWDSL